ncbi:transcription initiation factor TFIID subunit 12-like [Homarus americanus]|uniref:Transcription initiation factor TFIID subunit 12 n=1 Tax=Homarus americanus TaxID=6706 RepID=A0A8J5MVK2_HOMAM|nr:transcription initiation factor TFIID subunit 12-like [Homarus americanus]KAG7164629.1 Transcription initiation factor TFIID subunit 12-like [Homarus americanus]
MSQQVQQMVGGQVMQGQMVQVQGQVVSGTQVVNSAGQVVMSTTSGLTSLSGQQLVTQLVPGQTMQGQVVHQATAPLGVNTTLASSLTQGQVVNAQTVTGVQQLVQGQQIQTVNNHVSQPNMVAAATQVKTTGPNQAVPAPTASSNVTADSTAPVLNKQRITELVREVDPNEQLEEEVEEMLLSIADDFIESTVNAACRLAKHRGARVLDVKDVQMYLERNWHMWIPGFGTDELRPYKRAPTTEAHKQRQALIRKAIKKY